MRRILRCLTFGLSLWLMVAGGALPVAAQGAPSLSERVSQAEAAYLVGDYEGAVSIYEDVIAGGETSASVYFNLGNAYFELKDMGRALLNYQRAKRTLPRDAMLNRNLALARALRVDVQSDDATLIDALSLLTEDVMTFGELAWGVFGLWCAWCVALIVRRRGWILGVGAALCIAAALLGVRGYVAIARPAAVVVDFRVQGMSGAGAGYVPLFVLHSGAEGRIVARHDGWVRLLLPDGRQVWLEQSQIAEVGR